MKVTSTTAYGVSKEGSIESGIGIRFDNGDHYAIKISRGMDAEALAGKLSLCAMQLVACSKLEEAGIKITTLP